MMTRTDSETGVVRYHDICHRIHDVHVSCNCNRKEVVVDFGTCHNVPLVSKKKCFKQAFLGCQCVPL